MYDIYLYEIFNFNQDYDDNEFEEICHTTDGKNKNIDIIYNLISINKFHSQFLTGHKHLFIKDKRFAFKFKLYSIIFAKPV